MCSERKVSLPGLLRWNCPKITYWDWIVPFKWVTIPDEEDLTDEIYTEDINKQINEGY